MTDPDALVARLRAAGCVFAEDEAALLVAEATSAEHLERMTVARVSGTPLEHVLGWAEFDGLRVRVGAGVFVPRVRSAAVVREASEFVAAGSVVVDLCCGAGAIGAALSARHPLATVYAADLDPVAVASARENLPADRVYEGDLYDALPARLRGMVDVLVANAPYVPTSAIATMPPEARDYEARKALDGGVDGLDLQARVIAGAAEWLRSGGCLVIETSEKQAPRTAALMMKAGMRARVARHPGIDGTAVVGVRN